jgi:hypothetical protein
VRNGLDKGCLSHAKGILLLVGRRPVVIAVGCSGLLEKAKNGTFDRNCFAQSMLSGCLISEEARNLVLDRRS